MTSKPPTDSPWRARRALDRLAGGPRPGQLETLAEGDPREWVAAQIEAPSPASLDASWVPSSAFRKPSGEADAARHRRQQREIAIRVVAERLRRALGENAGLHETMAAFWTNHFSVSVRKPFTAVFVPAYEAALHAGARGHFLRLLQLSAMQPAMLFFLDNWRSAARDTHRRVRRGRRFGGRAARGIPRGPNENYARELLELHTLGVDGGYDQTDVEAVADVFTGWTFRRDDDGRPAFAFLPRWHEAGTKSVLDRPVEGRGFEEGEAVLRRLAAHPSTARQIARKLGRRFLADDPPHAAVERATREFSQTGGSIAHTLRALLLDGPELFDPALEKVKTPWEMVVSGLRAVGAELEDPMGVLGALRRLGEVPYLASSPAGHPDTADAWAEPGGVLERARFAFALAGGLLPGVRVPYPLPDPQDLLAEPVRLTTRAALRTEGLSPTEHVALALAAPEFQRR